MAITILDGPIGTTLIAQGHPAPAPAWSAACLRSDPGAVSRLHADYARSGATIHTANTFRTRRGSVGADWAVLADRAVKLARSAVSDDHYIAGSMAPIADCYRPDLSPPNPGPLHAELAEVLKVSGVDILLCETFPHIEEGLAAAAAALDTGLKTWLSFTAGPEGMLLSPQAVRAGAERAVKLGVSAVLINCTCAQKTAPYVAALADLGVPCGAYANAGQAGQGLGWGSDVDGPERYADLAEEWVALGATLIGGCCGTDARHIAALRSRFVGQTT